jgi:hypothetical protein
VLAKIHHIALLIEIEGEEGVVVIARIQHIAR